MIGSLNASSMQTSWNSRTSGSSSSTQAMQGPPPPPPSSSDAASSIMSSLDSDQSGGLSSSELQSFVDGLDSETRSSLLSLQEDSSSSTSSTSSTDETSSTDDTSSSDLVSQLMASLDEDGDGSVSEDELSSFMEANAPPPPPPPPGGPNGEQASTSSTDSSSSDTSSSTTTASTTSTSSTTSSSDTDTSKYSQMLAQMLMQTYGQAASNMMTPASTFDSAA